ncbi:ATP-binding protein [Pseudomonas kielensis]|uniref:AAA family ATPase n=1 Tax=Pseudomonas kielensis TaxID=2762577 RepID=UPI002240703E|nr:AAA family ATPase [Pseudomonas kielensis]UZM12118.1 ATP-binding protein [Pseudomonas kielensis]
MKKSAVKNIVFSNYRSFKSAQSLEVSPLTILFGYNNSGKSAAVRLVSMLSASFSLNKPETYSASFIDYTAPCLRGAVFKNISYANQNKMSFGVEWDDGESFSFDIKQEGNEDEILTALEFREVIAGNINKTSYIQSVASDERYVEEGESGREYYLDKFAVVKSLKTKKPLHLSISKKLKDFSTSVFWLNAVRVYPPREFTIDAGVRAGIRFDGGGTAETIWALANRKSRAFEEINEWLADTCGRKIIIDTLSQNVANERLLIKLETVSVSDHDTASSIRVPILDSGEGIAQALPVVTLCAQAANGDLGEHPIILLEQPELHLHPKAIVTLANFLVHCIKKNSKVRFIIETHSESLLLAVQTAIAARELDLSNVRTYWVSKGSGDEGSSLSKVEFDEDAYILKNFPSEIFQEVYEQAKHLIKIRESQGV